MIMSFVRRNDKIDTFKNEYIYVNKMELKVLESKKNRLKLEIIGEGHTFCNFFKDELWKAGADTAGYNIGHPLVGEPWLLVEGESPSKIIIKAVGGLRKVSKELRDEFKKVK